MPADSPSFLLIAALFVAAAAGWLFGRYRFSSFSFRSPTTYARNTPASKTLSEEYFRGLGFLLDEEPDKALEVFLRMVDVDNDTVETHFALGNLYRRRGEVERAIRVHENIMARPSLSDAHRLHAMFALGEDYFRAGLFDRAEGLFQALADGGERHVPALRYLLRIYEQQRDWEHAIGAHQRLVAVASAEHPTAIAHYHCELAEQLRAKNQFDDARRQLHAAREVQRNFPRSALIRADIALDMNQPELAALLCQRVVELHPKLLTLALPRVLRAMKGSDAGEIQRGFRAWIRPDPQARAELAYAAIVAGLEQEEFVHQCLPDLLREDPTLGEIVGAVTGDPAHLSLAQCAALANALGRVLRRTQRYRCVDCGFASSTHFWQCPGCRSWDAFAPAALLTLAPGVHRR